MTVEGIVSDSDLPDNPAQADEVAPADWAAIRHEYEHEPDYTVAGICRRHGISKGRLQRRIDAEDWPLRRPRTTVRERIARNPPSSQALIQRMINVLAHHVETLESSSMNPTEKEIGLLGTASRTLDKLLELEERRAEKSARRRPVTASAEMIELRKKIAERIDQLNQA
jgi:hypothetical protein